MKHHERIDCATYTITCDECGRRETVTVHHDRRADNSVAPEPIWENDWQRLDVVPFTMGSFDTCSRGCAEKYLRRQLDEKYAVPV